MWIGLILMCTSQTRTDLGCHGGNSQHLSIIRSLHSADAERSARDGTAKRLHPIQVPRNAGKVYLICRGCFVSRLAAFNAGFAVIKQTVLNGKDITSAEFSLQHALKEDLKARGNRKKYLDESLVKALMISKSSLPSKY